MKPNDLKRRERRSFRANRKRNRIAHNGLHAALAGILGAGMAMAPATHGRAQTINLGALNGVNGFAFHGLAAGDWAGYSVSRAGDINGDGFADVIMGAARPDGIGSCYVIFGNADASTSTLDLAALDGTRGFELLGESIGDKCGYSVADAGDINGDNFDDVIIGAVNLSKAYVVFGKASFGTTVSLTALNGNDGFKLVGEPGASAGFNVSQAGDVNGDGFDDLIVGAARADTNGADSGNSYVVFGKSFFADVFILDDVGGSDGFRIAGESAGDKSGFTVAGAGDMNGDGFGDLVVSAPYADPGGSASGAAYLLFGKASFAAPVLALGALDGTNGVKLNGAGINDRAGWSASGAGDVNGDGLKDAIVSAIWTDTNGTDSGSTYVVFGQDTFTSSGLALSALDGENGFIINGASTNDVTGQSVSDAGDVNGDGFDDVIIGELLEDTNVVDAGACVVIFGKPSFSASPLELGSLAGSDGFRMTGAKTSDLAGWACSGAGDFNSDGFDDLIIGTIYADINGTSSGSSYVLFGPAHVDVSKMQVSLKFSKPDKDSISLKGTIGIPEGFNPTGQSIDFDLGGMTQTLFLDAQGQGKNGGNSVRLSINSSNGTVLRQRAKFSASFKNGNFWPTFTDEGLTDGNYSKEPVSIGASIRLSNSIQQALVPLSYTAKQGKTGKAK